MKKRIYAVVILLTTVLMVLHATDITFDGKQKLYFNSNPSWTSAFVVWNSSSAVFSADFYGPSGNKFAGKAEQISGDVYAVTVPAGTWNHVIFTRHDPGTTIFDFETGHGFWSKSCEIDISQYQWDNYISNFNLDGHGTSREWNQLYSEQPQDGKTPEEVASYWGLTIENIPVCKNASGDPFTLTPNTQATTGGKYEYNYEMRAHAWFKTTNNGTTWTNVDGFAGIRASSAEGSINYNDELVGAAGSVTYYYLYAKEANDQRLIRVSVDKNCDVTCEITSFEVTPTAVNVGDNTYTMDGIVAFTKTEGSLIIECDGKTTTIASPVSPQTFSLPGLAADGKPEDFRVYFSGMSSCEMHNYTTAPIPTTDAITHPQVTIAPKETKTFTPVADGTDDWEWTLSGDPTILKNSGTNEYEIPAVDHDVELTYVYTEYNPTPTLPGNLMDNGSFEDVTYYPPFKWKTEYKNSNELNGNTIWDGTPGQKDIYDLPAFVGTYGYFGVTTNANTYWKLMSHVTPKDGSYLAVIDGDEVADKKAWYAATAENPNLKLMRGTTYLFSFWVANINNFGELVNNGRKNCAKLQFHIKCHNMDDDTWHEADLGDPIDLNDDKYMDFNWHQNSSTFSTREYFSKDFNADNVTISVVDKNNTGLTIANDFALDDIQFRPVSVLSRSIKAREFFKVKVYEPPTVVQPPVITITETPACGSTAFTMKVDISYSTLNDKFTPITVQLTDNVYGPIFATPVTIDPAVNPKSISFTLKSSEYPMLVADGAEHTLTAKITRIDGAGVDKGGQNSKTYISPTTPAIHTPVLKELNIKCDQTAYDLQVATEYLAFKGMKLHYEWDDSEWTDVENPALSYSTSWQTATGKLKNLLADGKNHKLHIYSDNALDCDYTFAVVTAPYMPSVTLSAVEIQPYKCDDENYSVKVTVDFTNGQGHDLIIKNWDGTTKTIPTEVTDTKKSWTFTYDWDATPTSHEYNVYFDGATTCDHKKSYTSHVQPTFTVTPSTINKGCDITTYSLRLDLAYVNQRGDNILANVDGGTDVVKANKHKSEMTEATDYFQFDNLPADGKTHKYTVRFDNASDCKFVDINYTAPYGPNITSAKAIIPDYHCGDGNYSVKVEVQFENGQGHDLIIEDWDGNKQHVSTDAADTKKGYNFSYGWNMTGIHAYKVYFEGAEDCGAYHQPSFIAQTEPKLTDVAYTISPATACDKTTYDMTVTFNYINQDGTLSVDVDGKAPTSITPAVLNSSVQQTCTATFEGLPADGGTAHKLNIAFTGGTHSCEAAPVTLTGVPHLPVINSVKQTLMPDYECGEDKYHVTLTVNYTNALGKKIVVKEGDAVLKSETTNTGVGTRNAQIKLDFDFSTNHALKVYFENRESCAENVAITSPAKPKVTATYQVANTECGKTTYDLEVEIKYTNQNGTLNVNVDGTPADPATVVFTPDSPTEQTLTAVVKNLPADGAKTHVLTVAFTGGSHSCAVDPMNVTAPYSPKFSAVTATVQPYACGDDKYKVNVEVNFSNGQGHNLIIEDWKGNTKSLTTKSTDIKAEHTFSYDWETPTTHSYKVYFVDAEGCNNNTASFTAPAEPKLTDVAYTISPATACNKTTYDMTVTFNYINQDGTLSVDVDGKAPTSITPAVLNSSVQQTCTATFEGLPADGGTAHKLNIAFTGGTHSCEAAPVTLTGVPHLPVINSVKQALTPDYACGEDKYHVTLTVNYTYALGKKIVVKEGDAVLKSITANTGAGTFETSIPLDFDFGTNHALKVYFENRESCAQSLTVTSPAKPKVTATYQVANAGCDKTTYDLEVEIKYTNQNGTLNVTVDGTPADPATLNFTPDSPTEQTLTAVVKNLPSDGAKTHVLTVAFTGGSHSCPLEPMNITAPYGPQISAATATVLPYTCNDDKYKVNVEVNFTNGQGHNLIIEDWNGNTTSLTTASTDIKAEQEFSYDWEAPTTHSYKVYFVDAEGCADSHTPSFDVPLWHHIEAVTVKSDATVPCNNPSFNAVVTVQASYDIAGQNLVFTYDDNGAKDTVVTATGQTTVATIPLHTIEGEDQTISVAFEAAPTCGKTSAPFTPAKRAGCIKDEVSVCEGDTYTWLGKDYTRPVGVDTITSGYDSLILTVKALPKITLQRVDLTCEDVASIALPYSIDKGTPDTYSLTVDGVAQPITAVTATDILIPSCAPGQHRAEVTVGVAGIDCETTATVDFTVAVAQQVYSKWTDVLFVSNKGGLYTAYQWYADYKLMDGETQQRLYDPEGLSGNNIVYFCQLTTTDGKTLYTCPKKFEDVPRSADQNTGESKVQSTMIYDNMGRILSGTPKNGMYIIVKQLENGDVRVRKIAVYE